MGNENAWRLHSLFLLAVFPKTQNSAWGYDLPGWSWINWRQMSERVMRTIDNFRAFDIMLEILQTMQEQSGCAICQMQVWKEGGRCARVRKALGGWGAMDDATIVETLRAYD